MRYYITCWEAIRGQQTDHPLQLMTYNHHRQTRGNRDIMRTSIEEGQTSTRPTERLLLSCGGAGWAGGQSLRRLKGRTCCHLSVLFRTTQIIQELLFSKVSPQRNNPNFATMQQFNSNSVSPKTFPSTNTNPSQTQFRNKIYFITYRFKPRSSIYKSMPNSVHKNKF